MCGDQREWAGKNPRAMFQDPITVDDVMNARMIAWPFTLLMCCLVTDGGGALIVTKSERAKDFPTNPVYILGTGESVETRMVSQLESYTSSRAFRVSSTKAFEESGIKHSDVDHLMIYDAFAHLPVWGLEDLGFCERGEGPDFIWERNTAPGGKLPMNTSGGGLSYTHTGMYGMFALRRASVKCAVQHRLKSKVRRSVSRCRRHVCGRRYDRLHKPRSLGGPPFLSLPRLGGGEPF